MTKRYFLHRISYEGNVSYPLLHENHCLTLGWSDFCDTKILEAARNEGGYVFDDIAKEKGHDQNRSRWNMWYFAQMSVGDTVIVPLYNGFFSAYEIREVAKPISNLEPDITSLKGIWNNNEIVWKDHFLYDEQEKRTIDLGFYVKVEPIVENVPRKYADGILISRMKIRSTSAEITDIKDSVESGIKAGKDKKPITLYGTVIDALEETLRTSITTALVDNKFELLIKWYFKKCGASSVRIPAKNEPGKTDGADADVIAEFDNLKYIVYVQAKWHKGETSDWAVHQIDNYKNQKSNGDSSYTYATWVISSAEKFSDEAIVAAEDKNVRLIDGKEFSRMLLDIGLSNINDAFKDSQES